MQLELAEIYHSKNEIPNELTALETFKEKYTAAPEISEVNGRLFQLYAMMKNDEQAKAIWPDLNEEQRHQEGYLEDYFKIVSKGDDEAVTEAVAQDLVKVDPRM